MAKILLVEDHEWSQDMLSRRLQRKGFQVVIAQNGKEGIALTKQEKPDVVLMDLNLPEMDGWDAARAMKQDEELKSIPIIALTSHAMAGDRELALESGCDDYEPKPIDFSRLLHKIHHLLANSST